MSIIHEALKKAALEGASGNTKPAPSDVLTISTQLAGNSRWIKTGLFILILLVSFSAAWYLSPLFLNRVSSVVVPLSAHPNQIIQQPVPTQVPPQTEKLSSNDSSHEAISSEHAEEGEQAIAAGIKLYREGKIDEASEVFQKVIRQFPSSSIAHNNFGMVLRRQGKSSEALSHYQEAIRLDSNYAEAENNIGLVFDQAGSIDEAAIHYKRAIEIRPTVPAFHLNYATLLERKGDFLSARKEYQTYLNLETDHKNEIIPVVQSHLNKLKGF